MQLIWTQWTTDFLWPWEGVTSRNLAKSLFPMSVSFVEIKLPIYLSILSKSAFVTHLNLRVPELSSASSGLEEEDEEEGKKKFCSTAGGGDSAAMDDG